ncbi:hypothetical protein ACR8AL_04700 [Clavibacter sepedonicus]|uniref:Integral membrane protein n=1 Tax=Clavibacter sepedonicus TaxID=31964 RepID=B0RHZ9_CLASE|nr:MULTISPECIES: hypothetical protein [Clavibacter]MBD5381633.1 hypothetical protein [Clavibacter sp.]OQJ47138.1 hypothetical protein B5P19_01715 [Clavibacter sepedonicus]OQJ55325.1 hypothetical protein B5P20_15405 [Clavibacter sepedonicus]UUK66681.1 hypothetical protein LRE50_05580 [Clavibacter sepedonicus]CAQ01426.1 putative integral membrane protein [Clavibacter sepedonicus]
MKGLQERFERASLGGVFLVVTAFYFVLRTGIDLVITGDGLSVAGIIGRFIGSLLFGGVMVAVIAWQRRRGGGASTSADVTAAIRSGQAPLAADPGVWIPALEWRRGQFRRSLWLTPLLFLVFIAMGVALLVLEPGSPIGWLVIVVFVGLGIGVLVQARRAIPRIDGLLHQLRERDGARGAAADAAPTRPAGA